MKLVFFGSGAFGLPTLEALARDHELYLVDLPGCGDSDHPDPDAVTPPVYTLDNVADRMLLTLRALPGFLNDERDVTLIGHSYGATLALHMLGGDAFIERYEDVHERIASAFLLAPADFDVYVPNPLMVRVSTVSDFEVWLADITGTLRETIARRERQAMADPHKAMREEVDARYDIIRNRAMRRATQALLRDIASLDDDLLPDWDRIEGLVAGYANVRVPVLIVFGARDEVLPPAMGFKIAAYVPYADVKIVPYCKHSVHVEYPEHCAELIRTYCHAGHVEGVADPDIPAHVRRTSPEDRRHSAHR